MRYSMDEIEEIQEFADLVCDILEIDVPVIRQESKGDTAKVKTSETQLAAASPDGREILLFQIGEKMDLYFALAHELRHVWQKKNRPRLINGYLPSSMLDIDTYNLQPAELDANAFGVIIMANFFHVRPLFRGLKEGTVDRIMEEAARIVREL